MSFLGMGTDRYPLPWGMLKYDTRLEGYVVPLKKEQLEEGSAVCEDEHAGVHQPLRAQGPRLLRRSMVITEREP
jgi:hypothetical protein